MYLINAITSDPKQKHTLILPSGIPVEMHIEFRPMQTGWFMSLSYEEFELKGVRICTSPNLLHQFKNLIPFGLACVVDEDQEPLFLEDFVSGRAKLYVLSDDDVEAFEDELGQATT